jgi:hypothetical protein
LNFIFTADIYNSRADIADSSNNGGFSLIWFRKSDTRENERKNNNVNPKIEEKENFFSLELICSNNEPILNTTIETFFTKKL